MSTAAATPPSWHRWSCPKPHGHFCLLSETVTSSCISHQPGPPHIWALLKCQSCSGQEQVGKTVLFFLCYTWLEKQMPCCLFFKVKCSIFIKQCYLFLPSESVGGKVIAVINNLKTSVVFKNQVISAHGTVKMKVGIISPETLFLQVIQGTSFFYLVPLHT